MEIKVGWYVADGPRDSAAIATNVLAVFTKYDVASDYYENAMNKEVAYSGGVPQLVGCSLLVDGERAFILRSTAYELADDYSSEPMRKEKEIKKRALAKLTDEEKRVLGLCGCGGKIFSRTAM